MTDQQITCSECGGVFTFTDAEHQFYESKGLASPPKRCRACRQARRTAREGEGGGGFEGRRGPAPRSFGGPPGAGGTPRPFGDRGDRGPRGAGRPFGDTRPNGPLARPSRPEGERFARDRAAGPGSAPSNGPRWGAGGEGEGRPVRPRDDAGFRASGTGERAARGPSQWARSGNNGGPGGDRANRPPRRFDAPARPARDPAPAEPPKPRARAEKPRFDIVCSTCGVEAQVPFKPIDGRQVFCQPCYRARRAPTDGQREAVGPEGVEGQLHELPAGASASEELDLEIAATGDELPPN